MVVPVFTGEPARYGGRETSPVPTYILKSLLRSLDILLSSIYIAHHVLHRRSLWPYRENCFVSSFKARFCNDFLADNGLRITGATRGIGSRMALALAKAGADIILVQRNTSNTSTRDAIVAAGRKADIVVCDLGDAAAVGKLIPHVTKELGRTLDIVVNCGGIQRRHPVENFPDDDWNEVLQVNLNTVFTITRDAGRHMLESRGGVAGEPVPEGGAAGNPRGFGKIINISSLVAFQGGLNVVAYAAAKHGVQGIVSSPIPIIGGNQLGFVNQTIQVKSFSNGWAAKGVCVNAIAPGYIATDVSFSSPFSRFTSQLT